MPAGRPRLPHTPPPNRPARRQPIRDSILAFLFKPRSASEIAAHIERTVPIATGHLAAMRRKGLVLRLGYAAYARADYDGPPLAFYKPDANRRRTTNRAALAVAEASPIRKTPL